MTRVHSCVSPCVPGLADLDQSGAGRLLVARRDAVLEVGQQHVDGRGDRRNLGDHLRVRRRQEVDHPRRPDRDLPQRLGGADGERPEEVLGRAHRGVSVRRPSPAIWAPRSQRRRSRRTPDQPVGTSRAGDVAPSATTRRSATRPATIAAGNSSTGAAPLARAWRTRPRAWRALPSYGGWVRADAGRADGRVGIGVTSAVPRTPRGDRALAHSAAPGGTRSRRGPSAPGSTPTRHRPARGRRPSPGPASPSAAHRRRGRAGGRCSSRRRRRRARRRTRGRPGPCTDRLPGRARRLGESLGDVAAVTLDDRRAPRRGGCAPAVGSRVPARAAGRRRARRRRTPRGREGVEERLPLRARPASAWVCLRASPRRRGSPTGRGSLATAGHAVAAAPRRARRRRRATPRGRPYGSLASLGSVPSDERIGAEVADQAGRNERDRSGLLRLGALGTRARVSRAGAPRRFSSDAQGVSRPSRRRRRTGACAAGRRRASTP